jgi:transcriptional regulator with XRE-family HTH domain
MKQNEQSGVRIKDLLGKNLRRLRAMANLSQLSLAGQTGLTHNFINDIENGRKWVSAETIARLAAALKVEAHQFFLPVSMWDGREADAFSLYLEDFSDSLQKMVHDYRQRYITHITPLDDEEL